MKAKLLAVGTAAVIVAAVTGGGLAVSNHWNEYQNKQVTQKQTEAQKAKQAQAQADQGKIDLLVKQNAALFAQCKKGEVAYAQLTTLTRLPKTTAVVCPATQPVQ
jgi:predicted negative regulator of RcsB-dependent stress response